MHSFLSKVDTLENQISILKSSIEDRKKNKGNHKSKIFGCFGKTMSSKFLSYQCERQLKIHKNYLYISTSKAEL